VAMAMCAIALAAATGAAEAASGKATYYVSLGDSAAAGLQPIGYTENRGYADQLYEHVRSRLHDFKLLKLGCSGETTDSLISGIDSPCTYPSGSQLNEAITFLRTHPGHVRFITIDIGGNDAVFVGGCWDPDTGLLDLACVQEKMPAVQTNLAYIIRALQAAAP